MKKPLSIVTLVALAALPLAAQTLEPPAEEPIAEEAYGAEIDPVAESEAIPAEDAVAPVDTTAAAELETVEAELPRTASPLALVALLGTAGAAAGLGVRRLRTR